ncbi:MAG: hypothetical protein AB1422_09405 [bacterium]
MSNRLPKYLKKYFWDISFEALNKDNYSNFIIERILEYGDEKAIFWMIKSFSIQLIKNTLLHTRRLSPKSANFWRLYFDLNKEEILCLKRSFQKQQSPIWNY